MSFKIPTIYCLIHSLVFAVHALYSGDACTTPNNESAQCISIYSCAVLYNVVRTRNPQQREFLRESQCGYQFGPLVCCGTFSNYHLAKPAATAPPPNNAGFTQNRLLPDRSHCGLQNANRILDGEATGLDEFPWMALLYYRKRNGQLVHSCGGTLISARYVISAAHCVEGPILDKVGRLARVVLGEWNTDESIDCINQLGFEICSDEPVTVDVEEAIAHPEYRNGDVNRYNDVALIRLNREVEASDFIRPICLPPLNERPPIGSNLFVAGWGKTEYANTSPVKLKLKVPLVDGSQCLKTFMTAGVTLGNTQLCAGGQKGKDSCNGDSGGPLMTTFRNDSGQWFLAGIVSFGAKCGSQGWPGIYTKVASFLPWIHRNIKE